LEVALAGARAAGAAALSLFQSPALTHEEKPDGSPVTPMDKEGERIIRGRIAASFPDDAILGEEFGEQAGTSGFGWIIDPIDGTRSYVAGVPTWGVLVGVEEAGAGVVCGCAIFPALGEALWASRGGGAWWEHAGRIDPARVSGVEELGSAIVETSHPRSYRARGVKGRPTLELAPIYEALVASSRRVRSWNDAYSLGLVSTGRVDCAIGFRVSAWDLSPFAIVLEEAGGGLVDWSGAASIRGGHFVAGNAPLRDRLRAIIEPKA
jgi:histidinol phosphatase-like enzyme (inositol monophosphatase family)